MRTIIATALVVCGLVACGAPPDDQREQAQSASEDLSLADFEPGERVQLMPMRDAPAVRSDALVAAITPPSGAHLTYYGGPVLSSVKVVAVYWGSGTKLQSHLNGFYKTVTNSVYFDWLKEYDTNTQSIGRGSFVGGYVITPSTTSKKITDKTVQKEIAKQITAGHLPKNDANTLYMVHFPPGLTVSMGGSDSCTSWCAYHGTFKKSGQMVFYGVVPDQSGACAGGCGPSPVSEGTTDVASHELIEAVTDPGVGLATSNAAPLAWYDANNGEIGDICAGQGDSTTVSGYTVQYEFSNRRNACVAK